MNYGEVSKEDASENLRWYSLNQSTMNLRSIVRCTLVVTQIISVNIEAFASLTFHLH